MADFYSLAFDLFSPLVKKYSKYFDRLEIDLRRARITVRKDYWASFIILVMVLSFVTTFGIGLPFALLLGNFQLMPMMIFLSVLIGTTIGAGILTYFYPAVIAGERQKKIDNTLPFSTIYMSTIARSGFPPQDIFKMISRFKEYGEISTEAQQISRDIETLGLDLPSALTRAINRSPSQYWSELLAGIRTTITLGGDLGQLLTEKTNGFVADYKRRLNEFSNLLSLLIEIYITIVVVGAVFFVVITSIMLAVGGVPVATVKALNYALVLVGLPVLTAAFILLMKGSSPLES
ncbi:MAG: type II secretion system F family protein [Nanoarchaeota archaeon]